MGDSDTTLAGALRSLLSATEFVAPNHDILSGTDAIACEKELRRARQGAEQALQGAIDHARPIPTTYAATYDSSLVDEFKKPPVDMTKHSRVTEFSIKREGQEHWEPLQCALLGTIDGGLKIETERVPYVALDLLRRYVRLVVQSEGSDLLKRAGTGGVDATFSADELALLARLSEDATR